MSIKINQTVSTPNIINALDAMKADGNINLGIETIEFPDGSKEKFCYNGEADKQAAVHFAQICIDVCAGDSDKAKSMMTSCFMLLTKGYNVDEIVTSAESEIDTETYIDYKIEKLKEQKDKTKYQITFDLEKSGEVWELRNLNEIDRQKIHGLY